MPKRGLLSSLDLRAYFKMKLSTLDEQVAISPRHGCGLRRNPHLFTCGRMVLRKSSGRMPPGQWLWIAGDNRRWSMYTG